MDAQDPRLHVIVAVVYVIRRATTFGPISRRRRAQASAGRHGACRRPCRNKQRVPACLCARWQARPHTTQRSQRHSGDDKTRSCAVNRSHARSAAPPFPCPCPASTTTTHRLRAFCPFGTTAEISPQCHMREGVRLGAMSWTGLQHESHVVLGNYLAGAAKRTGKRQRGCVLLEKPSWFAGEIDSRQRAWPGRAFNNVCEPRG